MACTVFPCQWRCVQVDLGAHTHQIPANVLGPFHPQAGQVAVHVTVDRVHEVALDKLVILRIDFLRPACVSLDVAVEQQAVVLVDHRVEGHELSVNVDWDPSGRAIPFFVTTIGPIRPAFVSEGSFTWE